MLASFPSLLMGGVILLVVAATVVLVFESSGQLGSTAVVHFVRALCEVSSQELESKLAPRVYSLTKIVEVAHYNMNRVRIVWSRIWSILADFFIFVGCHPTLNVAMYAIDALSQLAMTSGAGLRSARQS